MLGNMLGAGEVEEDEAVRGGVEDVEEEARDDEEVEATLRMLGDERGRKVIVPAV